MTKRLVARLILTAAVVFSAAGCGDFQEGSEEGAGRATPEPSTEYKLAVIQEGGHVSPDDPAVTQYASALDRLEEKCPDERERLADYAVRSQQLLEERGIEESVLDILRNARSSIPDEMERGAVGSCSDIFAAYVALRRGG